MNKQTEEALRMAIEAMETVSNKINKWTNGGNWLDGEKAINACKAALESQENEQEPVYFIADDSARGWVMVSKNEFNQANDDDRLKLYTRPTKRLSDDEKLTIIRKWGETNTMRGQELIGLCDAIEDKLMEINK